MSDKLDRKVDEALIYPSILQYHEGPVTYLRVNKEQTLLFSSGNDQRVNVHNLFTCQHLGTYKVTEAVKSFAITQDSKYIIISGFIGTVWVFEIEGELVGTFKFGDMKIFNTELSHGDEFLIIAGEKYGHDSRKVIFMFETQKVLTNLLKNHAVKENSAKYTHRFEGASITQTRFGYLNDKIFIADEEGILKTFDMELNPIETKEIFNKIPIMSLTFSKKFDFMLVSSESGAKVLNYDDYSLVTDLRSDYPVNCAQMSPLMYSENKPRYHVIMGGGAKARDTAFMKEGGLEIFIMSAIHGEILCRLGGHYGPINWIECFADGTGIITAGEESIVRVYRFDKKYFDDEMFD